MCRFPTEVNFNVEYIRDFHRGRDVSRFHKLEQFASRRWTATRDLGHARKWLWVIDTIKRRQPR